MEDKLVFRSLKNIPDFKGHEYFIPLDRLRPTITQIFAQNIMNKKRKQIRLILKMGTGTGKTLTSLLVSKPYIDMFANLKKKYNIDPRVYIIGFSEQVFKREFMKFPELGYITPEEKNTLKKLSRKLNDENVLSQYYKLYNKIRQRITNENKKGLYKFIGYKKLFNDLFRVPPSQEVNTSNILSEYLKGNLNINEEVFESFKYSLIICDEIHLAYNSVEANNYGLSLQLISDYYGDKVNMMLLSATIINNNKREIIDIGNLIKDPKIKPFKSEDYFSNNKNIKPLEPIYKEFINKVIFLEENTDDYPDLEYMKIEEPKLKISSNKLIRKEYGIQEDKKFLNFTESFLSPLQEATYRKHDLFNPEVNSRNKIVFDIVLPDPDYPAEEILKWNPNHPKHKDRKPMIGIYESAEIKAKYQNANPEWLKKLKIKFRMKDDYYILSGEFFKRENIITYSGKYAKMIDCIHNELKQNPLQKILIYHPQVRDSGIIMITEILTQNGFIDYGSNPKYDTLSSLNYITLSESMKQKRGDYKPATFFTLDFDVTANEQQRMIDTYNKEENKFGEEVKIFVGSQKIKQSIDFKSVQIEIIARIPQNIPEFIQIKGRVVRNGSASFLPNDMKKVKLYTLLSVSNTGITPELKKYIKKIKDFKDFQNIEKNINIQAMNNSIYGKKKFTQFDPLGSLDFNIKLSDKKIDESDYFYSDNYKNIYLTIFIFIKRLFIANPVWKLEELWNSLVNNPGINIYLDSSAIFRNLFLYIMDDIIYKPEGNIINIKPDIFDVNNIYINKYHVSGRTYNSIRKGIIKVGDYFVLVPINEKGLIDKNPNSFLRKETNIMYSNYLISDAEQIEYSDRLNKYLIEYEENPTEINKYRFLLTFDNNEHIEIIKKHIEKKYILPKDIYQIYIDLDIAGSNWYKDKDKLNKYEGEWNIYNKESTNKTDNKIIIGIVSNKTFKIKEYEEGKSVDTRKNKKGIVCSTTKKSKLLSIANKLGVEESKKVSTVCEQIYISLIKLEIKEIRNKGPLKYMYNFTEI